MKLESAKINDAVPLREGLGELDARVRLALQKHTVVTLLGALTAGYLIGRLLAKR